MIACIVLNCVCVRVKYYSGVALCNVASCIQMKKIVRMLLLLMMMMLMRMVSTKSDKTKRNNSLIHMSTHFSGSLFSLTLVIKHTLSFFLLERAHSLENYLIE